MKKLFNILKKLSTIIGAIVLIFFVVGSIYWGIDLESLRYNRNPLVTDINLNNEGPFIIKNDSIFEIKYIKGDADKGYFIEKEQKNINANFKVSCFYFPDSSKFSFYIKKVLKNERFEYNTPEKIIAISDIESNYKVFRDFLIANKVIDKNLNWIFGKGHLVLNGDFIDRSYFTTQVLWFIYKLEQEAEKNGGKIHYILGNHEIMNIQGDNRYAKRKYKNVASILGFKQCQLYDTPMYLGKWLQTKNVIEKIGNYLFVHGGISPEIVNEQIKLDEINRIAKENYHISYFPRPNQPQKEKLILETKTSPYWYRGYYKDKLEQNEINKILNFYNCSQIIVGHTIQKEVNRKYNGKIIGIDIEHQKDYYEYFPKLEMQGLLIENEKFYRINDKGKKVEI